jgi:hypothetical protein
MEMSTATSDSVRPSDEIVLLILSGVDGVLRMIQYGTYSVLPAAMESRHVSKPRKYLGRQ